MAARISVMKILYTWNYHRGGNGATNAILNSIELSRQAGFEVETFTRDSRLLPEGISGRLQAAASAIYAPESVRAFREVLTRFRPDVVHAYELFPLLSPWILPVCKEFEIPVILNCDDYFLTCPNRNHFREGAVCTKCVGGNEFNVLKYNCRGSIPESLVVFAYTTMIRQTEILSRNVTRFVAGSKFTRQWIVENAGIAPERVVHIPYPVRVPETVADPAEGTYVSYAGRFVMEKGIDLFVEAGRKLGIPFKLSRNESYPVNVPLPPEMEVVVTRGREDLDEYYRKARLLVFPSRWFETFGLVAAESMSHGIPVVAARIGTGTDLVNDGEDGFLFEAGNADDLAKKVELLWSKPELCREFGRKARAKVIREWSTEVHVQRLHALYADVKS